MSTMLLTACVATGWLTGSLFGWSFGCRRVTARKARIRREERRAPVVSMEVLLDLLPDAAVLLDGHGALRFANIEAKATFGEALGTIVRSPGMFAALKKLDGVTLQASGSLVIEVPVRRVVRVAVRLLPDALTTGPARVLAILSDHSEMDAVERMRADFVAYASHELRTPLAALSGFIETLRGPAADDPQAQQQFLGIMADQAARMQRLIEQLLELSRVEMLEHRKPRGRIEAASVIERVCEETAAACTAKGVVLDTAYEPLSVAGDEEQIIRVLVNLVENALKYAKVEARPLRIRVRIEAQTQHGRAGVVFVVEDDGAGIDTAHLPRLTERFYRVEGRGRTGGAGYGLGLAIVRHIVDRHGGSFEIDSIVGKGTCCQVWLPVA
ncbi:cell wall metabolism sensor histidine kinase WalK [Acetobacter estunensis]|uniref:sensor histidine kinase n=1 Tax=Acetobacter estunensis TaxID=104097 RepID=UPI001C2CEDBF|nr:ATP-binding protein [Acetobacter estunensis]MBV1836828.1 histidine kinase [Acetobacter estunensis]